MDMLETNAVQLTELDKGVVQITMQDEAAKNTFSAAIIHGLMRCFHTVAQDKRYKVVILTGYKNYFSSGATHEQMLQCQRGELSGRSIGEIMKLVMDCEIPVIAAMQGHALGGGFMLGLYADLIVFSRESIYTANFMKYGFTPDSGATIIVPVRFGPILGQEILYTARTYRGGDLEKRGIAYPVLPRAEVLAHARQLADQMADAPRVALVNLKKLLNAPWRQSFDALFEQELASLTETIQQAGVATLINARYGQ